MGGAKAQSRFSGKTAIPIGTCVPLSSAAVAPPYAAAQQARQPTPVRQPQPAGGAAASQPSVERHTGWGSSAGTGRTLDGSVPSDAGNSLPGEHTSRWVFDTRAWQWVLKGQVMEGEEGARLLPPACASDKHQLAARRWGDGRDALGAAALQAPPPQAGQQQAGAGGAPTAAAAATAVPAAAAAAAPAKRPRLHISAMTGDASDAGFASVGGLARQKEQLLEQVAYPLLHPRLFTRLGVSGARGVLLHGPPGGCYQAGGQCAGVWLAEAEAERVEHSLVQGSAADE